MNDKLKPKCKLVGENGNIFNLIAIASHTLGEAGMYSEAEEMRCRVFKAESYWEALCIIGEYVDIE